MLVALTLIIAIGLLFPVYQVKSRAEAETIGLQTELRRVNLELNQARLASDEAKQVEDTINEITDDVGTLKQEHRNILAKKGDFANTLKLVTAILPPEAYFTYISMDAGRITMKGETESLFTVISYATALETQGRFSEVRITEIDEALAVEAEVTEAEAAKVDINVITFDIVMSKQAAVELPQ